MRVILFDNVRNLGARGAEVSVAPGYFRNYLSPRGLAVDATEASKKRLQVKIRKVAQVADQERIAARSEAEKIEAMSLTFQLKAGEEDKLFGSVTNADIADKLAENGIPIDRHHIHIPEAIKRLGNFTAEVKLHHDVTAKLKIVVEKEA